LRHRRWTERRIKNIEVAVADTSETSDRNGGNPPMREHPIICVIALLGALIFWQAPEFVQQYVQRLGGAVAELEGIVANFDEDSRRSGYDRSAALQLMTSNPERLIRDQAGRMHENILRLSRLRAHQEALKDDRALSRLGAFVVNADAFLIRQTLDSYKPALSMTFEGLIFAALGFLVSYLLMIIVGSMFRRTMEATSPN
jgi:Protein of unknown function (DUF2937)